MLSSMATAGEAHKNAPTTVRRNAMAPALEFAAVSETKSFSRKTTNKFSSGLHSKKGQECTDDLIDQQPVRNQMEKENMANKIGRRQ